MIIPTRDRPEVLSRTLDVLAQQIQPDDEVIVVDNGSMHPDVAKLRDHTPAIRWIELGRNISCAARNVGAAAARGDVLVMLDDDSYPAPGTLDGIRDAFRTDRTLTAIACRIRRADSPDRHDLGGLAGVIVNCGAAMRRDVFLAIGGLPVDFDYYAEEYDLSCRIWRAGGRIQPRGDLSVLHARSTVNRDFNLMLRRLVRNNLRVWHRYAPSSRRQQLMHESIDRCHLIAQRESAAIGFEQGLADWNTEFARRPGTARPLSDDQFADLMGISSARRRLTRAKRRLSLRRIGVWDRGKGCPQLLELLRDLHIDVAAVYGPDNHGSEWFGVPLHSPDQIPLDSIDAIIPGTLSLGAADDQTVELRRLLPDIPIVAAISWSQLDEIEPAERRVPSTDFARS